MVPKQTLPFLFLELLIESIQLLHFINSYPVFLFSPNTAGLVNDGLSLESGRRLGCSLDPVYDFWVYVV